MDFIISQAIMQVKVLNMMNKNSERGRYNNTTERIILRKIISSMVGI
jgi:hypothetical protein